MTGLVDRSRRGDWLSFAGSNHAWEGRGELDVVPCRGGYSRLRLSHSIAPRGGYPHYFEFVYLVLITTCLHHQYAVKRTIDNSQHTTHCLVSETII